MEQQYVAVLEDNYAYETDWKITDKKGLLGIPDINMYRVYELGRRVNVITTKYTSIEIRPMKEKNNG